MFRTHLSFHMLVAISIVGFTLLATGTTFRKPAHSVVNIVMWQQWGGGHNQRALDKYIGLFNRTHPTIHVREIAVLDNTKMVAAISGGHAPDLMDLGSTGTLGQWAAQGLLQPLDTYIKTSGLNVNAFVPAGWNVVTFQGKRYGVPFMNFNNGLLFNVKEFQQAGITHPPHTLEEFNRDAAKLTVIKNGRIERLGFLPDYPGGSLLDYAWLFGGDWFKGSKSIAASTPNVQALQWESTFYAKYGPSAVTRFKAGFGQPYTAADGFQSGKLAMVYDGEWALEYAAENVRSLHIGTTPFPAPAAHPERTGTSYLDTNPQVIPTGSPHPKEAFEFIKWETSNPQLCSDFATMITNLPQLKNVPQTPLFKNPNFQVFVKEAEGPNAHQLPQTSVSSQFMTNLGTAEEAALLGKTTPRQALQNLQAMTQQELGSH